MDISNDEQLWARIKQKVDSGLYPSADAVMARALGLLEERDLADSDPAIAKERDDFRAKVQVGIDDLRNGRYKVYSRENRQELLEDIKQRALKLEAESSNYPNPCQAGAWYASRWLAGRRGRSA